MLSCDAPERPINSYGANIAIFSEMSMSSGNTINSSFIPIEFEGYREVRYESFSFIYSKVSFHRTH